MSGAYIGTVLVICLIQFVAMGVNTWFYGTRNWDDRPRAYVGVTVQYHVQNAGLQADELALPARHSVYCTSYPRMVEGGVLLC